MKILEKSLEDRKAEIIGIILDIGDSLAEIQGDESTKDWINRNQKFLDKAYDTIVEVKTEEEFDKQCIHRLTKLYDNLSYGKRQVIEILSITGIEIINPEPGDPLHPAYPGRPDGLHLSISMEDNPKLKDHAEKQYTDYKKFTVSRTKFVGFKYKGEIIRSAAVYTVLI